MIPFCILAIENDDDREFMAELFLRYQRLLYNEIYEILKNPWNTEDVLQATLVKLIDKISELRKKEETKLVSYMVVVARNNTYNFLRAQKKSAQVAFEEYSGQENSASADRQIESGMIAKEEIEEMVRRWSQLDERLFNIFSMEFRRNRLFRNVATPHFRRQGQCPHHAANIP